MAEQTMTLEQLKSKLPTEFSPIVDQYGLTFLSMGKDELWAWINRAAQGDMLGAYRDVLSKQSNADLLTGFDSLNKQWATENKSNAARVAWQRDAMSAILKVMVSMALATVGL